MASITFVAKSTTVPATWLQAVNDFVYTLFAGATTIAQVKTALGISSFAETILDDTTAGAVRTTIGSTATGDSLFTAASASAARSTLSAAASGANTDITSIYLDNTGLKVKDSNASHGLSIVPGSNITADRTLTITTGDSNRTITLSGDTTLSGTNTGDQTVPASASQAEQETGSSTTVYVSPGTQQYHPSAAKGWANVNGASAAVNASYNVSGTTDQSTGIMWVSWNVDFSTANHVTLVGIDSSTNIYGHTNVLNAGIDVCEARNTGSGANADPTLYHVVAFGDQ